MHKNLKINFILKTGDKINSENTTTSNKLMNRPSKKKQ